MQKNLTIKELPDTERPYEKCLRMVPVPYQTQN